ncbi:hypothetical protein [Streptomyces sp. NPDC086989]|uniref:hypothetical protein n=1 Tax=Streptomyces sp. NPDC086989 TaxID=3365764 RepID=UPI00380A0384
MKIFLMYGPEHGRTINVEADQYCGDFWEVRRTLCGFSYQLTDRKDDEGRRIAVAYRA